MNRIGQSYVQIGRQSFSHLLLLVLIAIWSLRCVLDGIAVGMGSGTDSAAYEELRSQLSIQVRSAVGTIYLFLLF